MYSFVYVIPLVKRVYRRTHSQFEITASSHDDDVWIVTCADVTPGEEESPPVLYMHRELESR